MKTAEQGFTLIESLLVLSIFLVISSIAVFYMKPQYESKESEAFLTQLKADLLFGQQYAISHQAEVTVTFSSDQHYYYMRTNFNSPTIIMRNYSKAITVSPGTLPLSFKFTPGGNVSKFGSLSIQCGNRYYQLTFLIGKGRFYVIEK